MEEDLLDRSQSLDLAVRERSERSVAEVVVAAPVVRANGVFAPSGDCQGRRGNPQVYSTFVIPQYPPVGRCTTGKL